jgi:ATP-dependent helicase/nuclease subunit B
VIPNIYSIPLHRGFADALAAGLCAQTRGDRLALARTTILLPNSRARRQLRDAFVRRADGGLLLPRLVAIGDAELGEAAGLALDPADEAPLPPAIDRVDRQLTLACLVQQARDAAGEPVEAGEAVRLAADLARVLDQLTVEDVSLAALTSAVPPELSEHWNSSLAALRFVMERWPALLASRGLMDGADRTNRLLDRLADRWRREAPAGTVVAAGFNVAAPALARLLRVIARLPNGRLILPALDLQMVDEAWRAIAGSDETPGLETHPQHGLAQLLDRIGVARGEVKPWRWGRDGAAATRTTAINNAMAPAAFSDRWADLPARARRLSGVCAVELATPAAEAQAIALAVRQALETPERTVALVTPDRDLAVRVSGHLARWNIAADDSAGRPLSRTAAGTLLLALVDAAAEGFAPVPLLALLKHPLVRAGEDRLAWLDGARQVDRALRGPRPRAGLDGVADRLSDRAAEWWQQVVPLLAPLQVAFAAGADVRRLVGVIRETASALGGDAAWSGADGRAAASLLSALEAAQDQPRLTDPTSFAGLLRPFLDAVAVRPPQGGHPRVFIWGLIEARLGQTDLMILGGLNEGVWPSLPAPDPWLAPAVRRALGLPGLDRRIGTEAQQFASGLGARAVLVTRARRDARAPAVASRFWLRLQAMTGGLAPARSLIDWVDALDRPARFLPAERPQPRPPLADRPRRIAVTKLDRLRADPFAFYADAMLRLRAWEAVDADPSAAWRGSALHKVFEAWIAEDGADPARLRPRAEQLLGNAQAHPVLRVLWSPRLLEAIDWATAQIGIDRAEGRLPFAAEVKGQAEVAGIRLEGTVDRLDRLPGGGLAIVDWKTGQPPSRRAVLEGYSMQLGLLGLLAERGAFGPACQGRPAIFEYWSMAASRDGTLGYRASPVGLDRKGEGVAPEDFTTLAARVLAGAVQEYLAGDAPFVAKLHPEYAPYADYDQLMRLDEWYGRIAPEPAR